MKTFIEDDARQAVDMIANNPSRDKDTYLVTTIDEFDTSLSVFYLHGMLKYAQERNVKVLFTPQKIKEKVSNG